MPVDTGLYGNIQPVNPLAGVTQVAGALGSLASAQNSMNANAQFQQEFAARQAMGPILQNSIDPTTGQVDWSQAIVHMAADPKTAYLAPQMYQQLQQANTAAADAAIKNVDATSKKWAMIGQAANGAIRNGQPKPDGSPGDPEVDDKALMENMAQLASSGIMNSSDLIKWYQGLPADGPGKVQALRQMAIRGQTITEGLNTFAGAVHDVASPAGTTLTQVSPVMGSARTVGTVAAGVAPSTMLTSQSPTTGETVTQPFTQKYPNAGGPNPFVPAQAQSQVGGNPLTPQAAAAPQAQPQANAPVMTKISPYDEGKLKDAVVYRDELNGAAQTAIKNLQVMDQQMDQIGKYRGGGGADMRAEVARIAQAIAPDQATAAKWADTIAGGGPGAYAAQQEMEKYAAVSAMTTLISAQGSHYRPAAVEYTTLYKNLPRPETDPRATQAMLAFNHKLGEQILQEQSKMGEYERWLKTPAGQASGSSITDWPQVWSQYAVKHKYFDATNDLWKQIMKDVPHG